MATLDEMDEMGFTESCEDELHEDAEEEYWQEGEEEEALEESYEPEEPKAKDEMDGGLTSSSPPPASPTPPVSRLGRNGPRSATPSLAGDSHAGDDRRDPGSPSKTEDHLQEPLKGFRRIQVPKATTWKPSTSSGLQRRP